MSIAKTPPAVQRFLIKTPPHKYLSTSIDSLSPIALGVWGCPRTRHGYDEYRQNTVYYSSALWQYCKCPFRVMTHRVTSTAGGPPMNTVFCSARPANSSVLNTGSLDCIGRPRILASNRRSRAPSSFRELPTLMQQLRRAARAVDLYG